MSSNKKDILGDRMKYFEKYFGNVNIFDPQTPIMVRLDGKGFSKFTKGLSRPFDKRLSDLMIAVTIRLVEMSNARMGYTQSDEISLVLYEESPESQVYFNGRMQKIVSVLASIATAHFNAGLPTAIPEKAGNLAFFDCRCWSVPDKEEAANAFLWRELDASKNSISMAARTVYSHKEMHSKSGRELVEMMREKCIEWEEYPDFFKRGTFVQRKKENVKFTAEEVDRLPEHHEARSNPDLIVERSTVKPISMPEFRTVKNRSKVIFDGEFPST
jgi:tRNA(His) 5'-end guanylyltransferase